MSRILVSILFLLVCLPAFAQPGRPSPKGKFYGKVLDAGTGKSVPFATVRLFRNEKDSVTGLEAPRLVTGVITQGNGEFSLDDVPMAPAFEMRISAIGYREHKQSVSFPKPQPGAMPVLIKDLGNIRISMDTVSLAVVEIDGSAPAVRFEADKKVYDMKDNAISSGGTGEDVLKTLPGVNVDMDGNVSLRNQAPQIFVDGKLTTLTIDQIPAEAIESVEVITNPSAKYDASGGGGGIINVVLKKDRRLGYHGNLRAGVDMFGKVNAGGDVNVREGKFNFFVSGMVNQRKSVGTTETDRRDFYNIPVLEHNQFGEHESDRLFMFGRAGVDYFINNRSTITLSHTAFKGGFTTIENLRTVTDTVFSTSPDRVFNSGGLTRVSESSRNFSSQNSSILFKHLFPKDGRELTADVTYNQSGGGGIGEFSTVYDRDPNNNPLLQRQDGTGENQLLTVQSDYTSPVGKGKMEAGLRGAARTFTSTNESFIYNHTEQVYIPLLSLAANYAYTDQVYAAYLTYARSVDKKFGYQVGLRAESSFYQGELLNTGQKFSNQFPISLFPSASGFVKVTEKSDIQGSYTRRVNRPSFFSLMPFTDFSDSLNIKRGNPALKPEFTHSGELSYLKSYGKENSFMATSFVRYVNGLFSAYQFLETNPESGREAVITSTRNEGSAFGYGIELTSRTVTKKILEVTANATIFNASISGSNSSLNNTWAWYGKLNVGLRLPKNFTIQSSVDYESRTIYEIGDDGGGHGFDSQANATSQGYSYPEFEVDLAIRKDFLDRKLTATLNVSDIFKTDIGGTYTKTDFFEQEVIRKRNQQYIRFMLSYRFGKFDQSLFRRKNTRNTMDQDGGF